MTRLPDLPVLEAMPELRRALAGSGSAVLAAPPGSGKTTVAPLALLDEPWLAGKKIVMLEPRRLAARMAAMRMASLLGEKVGETVGYQIRFERRVSARTRVEVITEGLLARRLQSDPELPGVGLVIFDEFHERSLDADLALALTLDARVNLNPALRVLVMSATLDTTAVSKLLGDAPIVSSAGRLFPVDIRHLAPRAEEVDAAIVQGALAALAETTGDILIFLPGAREIRGAQRKLEERLHGEVFLAPLYGDLDSAAQDAALRPAPDGRRKIILATNIAQTSITVEGVTTVVDGGWARVARFDRASGANRLETQRISRAAADQRAGRAGRLGPGVCYRMWSAEQHGRLPAQDAPEILVSDLSRFALELVAWGVAEPAKLALLDPPPAVAWQSAVTLLRELGALDEQSRITAHGKEIARLPATPRRAHMLLLAKQQGLAPLAAWTAALLEDPPLTSSSDLSDALTKQGVRNRRVDETARQLLRIAGEEERAIGDVREMGRVIAWAYPERIARARAGSRGVFLCEDGGEARVPEQDALASRPWLAIAHWDPGQRGQGSRRIRLAAQIDEKDVLKDHAERIRWFPEVRWDAASRSVVAEEQQRLGAIVLGRRTMRGHEEAVRAAMLNGIRSLGMEALPWTEAARSLQARVLSLRAWRPDEDWPDVRDATLMATLEDWLGPHLDGITRREHLPRLDLADILKGRLDYAHQRRLNQLAPTHLAVPSGSNVQLRYEPPEAPVLEVKLQELFGCTQTPAVNEGRTPVTLHLLSPARRPIQVTRDLAGFWARTYPEVKKELKGRYPRHPWPEDPLAAVPTRRAKPRGT